MRAPAELEHLLGPAQDPEEYLDRALRVVGMARLVSRLVPPGRAESDWISLHDLATRLRRKYALAIVAAATPPVGEPVPKALVPRTLSIHTGERTLFIDGVPIEGMRPAAFAALLALAEAPNQIVRRKALMERLQAEGRVWSATPAPTRNYRGRIMRPIHDSLMEAKGLEIVDNFVENISPNRGLRLNFTGTLTIDDRAQLISRPPLRQS